MELSNSQIPSTIRKGLENFGLENLNISLQNPVMGWCCKFRCVGEARGLCTRVGLKFKGCSRMCKNSELLVPTQGCAILVKLGFCGYKISEE